MSFDPSQANDPPFRHLPWSTYAIQVVMGSKFVGGKIAEILVLRLALKHATL